MVAVNNDNGPEMRDGSGQQGIAKVRTEVGRPRIEISRGRIRAIAQTFATYEEIGAAFGCSADTIRRGYRKEVERGWARGKLSLRRKMAKRARTSDRVLIHLYDRHVEPPQARHSSISIVPLDGRPLIIREVDEGPDLAFCTDNLILPP